MYVISDLTPVYKDQVKSAKRAVSLVDKEYVVVEDVIEATKRFTMMTWTMVTPASAKIVADNVMLLEKDGKKLYIKVEAMIRRIRVFQLSDLIRIWNYLPNKVLEYSFYREKIKMLHINRYYEDEKSIFFYLCRFNGSFLYRRKSG